MSLFRVSLTLVSVSLFILKPQAVLADNKTYRQAPFTTFASQMFDALQGDDQYEKPVWNLHDALDLPQWLRLRLESRTRYETLDGSFKRGSVGGDQQIAMQTDAFLEARWQGFRLGGEFLDARQQGADTGSGVNNTHVNEADMIEGYLAWSSQNLLASGLGVETILGRQSLNLGSRRLVARNAFRNTINAFDGFRLRVLDYERWQLNSFVTLPVNRYPSGANDILNDVDALDVADGKTLFSGAFLELFHVMPNINAEIYFYHLDEADTRRSPSRNRRLFTTGGRILRQPQKDHLDFQVEMAGQWGEVRATTTASDAKDLNHGAWLGHWEMGYTLTAFGTPRFALLYDYASGDENPNDNNSERFDTLFGARRWEYGPTGIYGVFGRSNVSTPGYQLTVKPQTNWQIGFMHRAFWLAQESDAWTSANLQDVTGQSGHYIGQQIELTSRWDVNSSLGIETGWTHLFKGKFAKDAPRAPEGLDLDYFFVQSLFRF